MKKLLLIPLALIISLSASYAQSVPKHEFSFSASYSLTNTFICYIQPDQSATLSKSNYSTSLMSSLAPMSFEYTYHFDDHLGITTGISILGYAVAYGSTGQRQYCAEGSYSFDNSEPPPIINAPRRAPAPDKQVYGYEYSFTPEYEQNDLVMEFISIPVLAYYRSAFGNGKWNFYSQAGFKFGYAIAGQVNSIAHSDLKVSTLKISWDVDHKVLEKSDPVEKTYSSKKAVEHCIWNDECNRFNIFASLEGGVRIPIWRSLGIYTGVYADLGLLRATKYSHKQQYSLSEDMETSLFGAREETPQITADKDGFTLTIKDKPLLRGVLPFSAGFRVRIAF